MNDPLGNAFKSVIPEPPTSEGWAQGARRRRRNRQVAVSMATAAAVTAVALPVALNLPQFNSPQVASPEPTAVTASPTPTAVTPSPSPSPTSTPTSSPPPSEAPSSPPAQTASQPDLGPAIAQLGAAACFDEGARQVDSSEGGKPLTRGAVRAWLCGDAPEGMGTVGPVDALTTDVDRILDFFNDQPALDSANKDCGYEYSTVVRVVLEYDDGSTTVVKGAEEGCSELTDGHTQKQSGDFVAAMVDLWKAQRADLAEMGPELEFLPHMCLPAQYSLIQGKVGDAVGGVACVGETPADAKWVDLSEDLARRIGEEAAKATQEEAVQMGTMRWVVLSTAWGDQIALERQDDGSYQFRDGDRVMTWTPSASVAAELDPVFARLDG
ncbi:hypothetical protein [Tessaracoccus flavescens]|uniref:Uncharacterized protein n=1 Tax=Tessaracoccus flavescens TaxID=399497 RepID=A0A1Q2CWP5_9ACTN|nr:hypothetical protein [Tessaracoccus flavescens]AQP50535.1 hypothetical protein BW733_06515 [Tessaracoccus flavescens]